MWLTGRAGSARVPHARARPQQARRGASTATAILGMALVAAGPLSAGAPFVTDDPETPPAQGWEINVPVIAERDSGDYELEMPLFDINYGLRDNLQLKVEFSHLSIHPRNDAPTRGISDATVGLKWRILEEEQAGFQMAVYPQAVVPMGSTERGLGDGSPAYLLPVIAQKGYGEWTAFGNVGMVVQTHDGSRDYWFWGAALQRRVTERLELAAEVFGNSAQDLEDRSSVGFNVGGIWEVTDGLGVLLSAGRAFGGGPDAMVYVGVQILAGGGGKSPG
jgi:hypothetical protein